MNANEKAPTNAAHDLQKQRIMAHAVQAFARIGYASASMAELARACEVSKATLYHYFDSKDAILFAAADAYVRRLNEVVTTALAVTEQSQPPDHQAQAEPLRLHGHRGGGGFGILRRGRGFSQPRGEASGILKETTPFVVL